ncbi:MAG: hypothetical protein M3H12_06155, partial [Chromatiales bacterium]
GAFLSYVGLFGAFGRGWFSCGYYEEAEEEEAEEEAEMSFVCLLHILGVCIECVCDERDVSYIFNVLLKHSSTTYNTSNDRSLKDGLQQQQQQQERKLFIYL